MEGAPQAVEAAVPDHVRILTLTLQYVGSSLRIVQTSGASGRFTFLTLVRGPLIAIGLYGRRSQEWTGGRMMGQGGSVW